MLDKVSQLITEKLKSMVETADLDLIRSKRKAISTLFPYVTNLVQGRQQGIVNTFSHAARASNLLEPMWPHLKPYIATLFGKPTHPSLDWIIILASPHVPWHGSLHDENTVSRWAMVASAVSYTEEVGQSVVDVLLQIASIDSLRSHIPISVWVWLKKQPPLPPKCLGRSKGTRGGVVRHIQAFRDVDILKSYLLLVWSEWDLVDDQFGGLDEMQVSIQEDFGGIGMKHYREDLIKRLDQVLVVLWQMSQLGWVEWWEYIRQHGVDIERDQIKPAMQQYRKLKRTLLKLDREAATILTRMPLKLFLFSLLTHIYAQNPT